MNCTVHPESAATAYCRTCGKAMCDACKHTVQGVIYCEDCLASRVNQPMIPVSAVPGGAPSPGLAMALGFIPGVGAMYNGQFVKGLVHVGVFATLCAVHTLDIPDALHVVFGLAIPFWIFYMVFDAYKTAKARLYGLPLPDPFGIERAFGSGTTSAAPAAAATFSTPGTVPPPAGFVPGQPVPPGYVAPQQAVPREPSPVGAIVLIGLGVLFLLNQFGMWQFHWLGRMWPLILIGLGVWLFIRRFGGGPTSPEQQQ
jgi:TM2 domain-containing membrane protein YozV